MKPLLAVPALVLLLSGNLARAETLWAAVDANGDGLVLGMPWPGYTASVDETSTERFFIYGLTTIRMISRSTKAGSTDNPITATKRMGPCVIAKM